MRRFYVFLALLAGSSIFLGGCAVTDFNNGVALPDQNSSHQASDNGGVLSGGVRKTKIPGHNTQQNLEPVVGGMSRAAIACPPTFGTFGPPAIPLVGAMSGKEARDLARFIGNGQPGQGIQVNSGGPSSPNSGHWEMMGTQSHACGGNALSTWNACLLDNAGVPCGPGAFAGFNPFSSLFGGGAQPEMFGDQVTLLAGTGWAIETFSVDNSGGFGFGGNIIATTPARNAAGYQTFVGFGGFAGNAVGFLAVKPGAGLTEFFAGTPIDVDLGTVGIPGTAKLTGDVRQDGMIDVTLHELNLNDHVLNLTDPITVAVTRDMKQIMIDITTEQNVEIYDFVLNYGDQFFGEGGVTIEGFIPELGVEVQPISVQFSRDAMEAYVVANTGQIEGRDRDRLR